jgi:hypothetical protein
VSDIDTAAADGLKVLDPKRPIREADITSALTDDQLLHSSWPPRALPLSSGPYYLGRNCDAAVFAPGSTMTRVPTRTRL